MKKIEFIKARFVASAFDEKTFPKMQDANGTLLPEIALVGRSNVGKSSLINNLLRNPRLAKTSSTPGKTQSINFFCIDEMLGLVDLPGYGYAKVPKQMRGNWGETIEHYLQSRSHLNLILLLIDSRRDLTEEDLAFVQWAQFHHKPLLFVLTKSDKVTPVEVQKRFRSFPETHFLSYSIKDPTARIRLIEKINHLLIEGQNLSQ